MRFVLVGGPRWPRVRIPGAFFLAAGARDRYGLRPRSRPDRAGPAAALRRLGGVARALLRCGSRPLPRETLVWIVMVLLVLCFAVALFTRERAIAP